MSGALPAVGCQLHSALRWLLDAGLPDAIVTPPPTAHLTVGPGKVDIVEGEVLASPHPPGLPAVLGH